MDIDDIAARLDLTRARVEGSVGLGGVITVTSALDEDGAPLLAKALATNMASVGHSVLLVDARTIAPPSLRPKAADSIERSGTPLVHRGAKGEPSHFDFGTFDYGSTSQATAIRSAIELFRETFDYTVVATAAAATSAVALACAAQSNGVIVAFREGRPAKQADHDLVRDVRSAEASLLGVVTLNGRDIRRFGNEPFTGFAKLEPLRSAPARELRTRTSELELFTAKASR